jgi:hypothetical protein
MGISTEINAFKTGNILGVLEKEFPLKVLDKQDTDGENIKNRERVFTSASTLLTMVLTATQKDKSLKNSVNIILYINSTKRKCWKT